MRPHHLKEAGRCTPGGRSTELPPKRRSPAAQSCSEEEAGNLELPARWQGFPARDSHR